MLWLHLCQFTFVNEDHECLLSNPLFLFKARLCWRRVQGHEVEQALLVLGQALLKMIKWQCFGKLRGWLCVLYEWCRTEVASASESESYSSPEDTSERSTEASSPFSSPWRCTKSVRGAVLCVFSVVWSSRFE